MMVFVYMGIYNEMPKNINSFVLFSLSPIKDVAKRNKVIREIFGRTEKNYFKEGIIGKLMAKEYLLLHL